MKVSEGQNGANTISLILEYDLLFDYPGLTQEKKQRMQEKFEHYLKHFKIIERRFRVPLAWSFSTERLSEQISPDDQRYVEDLGLITTFPQIFVSNRIYSEIIPRELTWVAQTRIVQDLSWYQSADQRLDMRKLLSEFQQFFRKNSEIWIERFQYKEAGPQLLLQAFLQRVLNGGGRLNREYGLGRKRTDLLIQWPLDKEKGFFGPVQRIVIELKILKGKLDTLLAAALDQTADYADKNKADEAHIIIFNRDPGTPWNKKIWQKQVRHENIKIRVWGC